MNLDKNSRQGAFEEIKVTETPTESSVDTGKEPVETPVEPKKPVKELVKRMTVSLPPEVLENGKIIARMSNKNFSQYVCELLKDDARTDNSQYLLRQSRNIKKTIEKVTQ